MSDEPKPDEKLVQDPPKELTLVRHGKKTTVPIEKAIELAQKGFDYEQRTAEIRRQEAKLKADEAGFSEYERFKNHLASNRAVNDAVQLALQDPDRVLRYLNGDTDDDAVDDDEIDVGKQRKTKVRHHSELEAVKAELREMKEGLLKRDVETAKQKLDRELREELSGYPWLKGKQAELAHRQALAVFQETGESLPAVAAMVASDFKSAWEENQVKALETNEERKRLKSLRPGTGERITIGAEEPPKKSDLFDGGLLKRAMESAAKFGIGD